VNFLSPMIHEYVSYILCLYMNMCLLFVCMQMCDPATHTYDDDTDDRDGQLLVALYDVDIWGRPSSEVSRRTMLKQVFNGLSELWGIVTTALTCFACDILFLDDCMIRWWKVMVCFQAVVSVLWKL
jgi:hypothetical protein